MSQADYMVEQRKDFKCTCGTPYNFCYMEWKDGKGYFKCVNCEKIIEAKRRSDHEEFNRLKQEWNGK